MKPSLRQLEYMVAIAETGSFSEAALRTHVSQPSLSAQVKDMEENLGAVLFERGRRGAFLTPVGEQLVVRARIILGEVEALKTLARESDAGFAGRIRLGVLPSIGPYLLPKAVRALHERYTDLRIIVREERTSLLQEHLNDGRFDIIISTPEDHPDARNQFLFQEDLYICVAPDDPLATDGGPVSLSDLHGRELLSLGTGHKLTLLVTKLAELATAQVSSEYEGTSLDAIRQMSSMGGSVAILPSLYAISEARRDPDLIVRPIKHPLARRNISLIWRPASPLSEKFREIGTVLEQTATQVLA